MSEDKKKYWQMIRDMDGPDLIRFGHKEGWTSEQWRGVGEFRARYRPRDIVSVALEVFPGATLKTDPARTGRFHCEHVYFTVLGSPAQQARR